jgi:hypothetical protein
MATEDPRPTAPDPGPRAIRRWRVAPEFRQIEGSGQAPLEDHRRHPLCRLLIYCAVCGWARDYNPERIVARLQALRQPGYQTRVSEVAARVSWSCPACGRVRWVSRLAYSADMTARDVARALRAIRC